MFKLIVFCLLGVSATAYSSNINCYNPHTRYGVSINFDNEKKVLKFIHFGNGSKKIIFSTDMAGKKQLLVNQQKGYMQLKALSIFNGRVEVKKKAAFLFTKAPKESQYIFLKGSYNVSYDDRSPLSIGLKGLDGAICHYIK